MLRTGTATDLAAKSWMTKAAEKSDTTENLSTSSAASAELKMIGNSVENIISRRNTYDKPFATTPERVKEIRQDMYEYFKNRLCAADGHFLADQASLVFLCEELAGHLEDLEDKGLSEFWSINHAELNDAQKKIKEILGNDLKDVQDFKSYQDGDKKLTIEQIDQLLKLELTEIPGHYINANLMHNYSVHIGLGGVNFAGQKTQNLEAKIEMQVNHYYPAGESFNSTSADGDCGCHVVDQCLQRMGQKINRSNDVSQALTSVHTINLSSEPIQSSQNAVISTSNEPNPSFAHTKELIPTIRREDLLNNEFTGFVFEDPSQEDFTSLKLFDSSAVDNIDNLDDDGSTGFKFLDSSLDGSDVKSVTTESKLSSKETISSSTVTTDAAQNDRDNALFKSLLRQAIKDIKNGKDIENTMNDLNKKMHELSSYKNHEKIINRIDQNEMMTIYTQLYLLQAQNSEPSDLAGIVLDSALLSKFTNLSKRLIGENLSDKEKNSIAKDLNAKLHLLKVIFNKAEERKWLQISGAIEKSIKFDESINYDKLSKDENLLAVFPFLKEMPTLTGMLLNFVKNNINLSLYIEGLPPKNISIIETRLNDIVLSA